MGKQTNMKADSLQGVGALAALTEVDPCGHVKEDLVTHLFRLTRQAEQVNSVTVQSVVQEVLQLIMVLLPDTIRVSSSLDDCEPVRLGSTELHQILMNLFLNAIHAMEPGGGVLRVEVRDAHGTEPESCVCLSVSDTGIGIPADRLGAIFKPYVSTKKNGKGLGLGLCVVDSIVKSHGGSLSVISRPGQGSTFRAWFPKVPSSNPSEALEVRIMKNAGTERILFVEDEIAISTLVKKQLERFGYSVTAHFNGAEALGVFKADPERFDLVISDMGIPGLNGLALAEEIRQIRPDIPILICSGSDEYVADTSVCHSDICGFLLKPFTLGEITHLVRSTLDHQASGKPDS